MHYIFIHRRNWTELLREAAAALNARAKIPVCCTRPLVYLRTFPFGRELLGREEQCLEGPFEFCGKLGCDSEVASYCSGCV